MSISPKTEMSISPKMLAAIEGVHVNTVYNWINDGLPIRRSGKQGRICISYQEFRKWQELNFG